MQHLEEKGDSLLRVLKATTCVFPFGMRDGSSMCSDQYRRRVACLGVYVTGNDGDKVSFGRVEIGVGFVACCGEGIGIVFMTNLHYHLAFLMGRS